MDQAAPALRPIQPLPDLLGFAEQLKLELAAGCRGVDAGAERAALLAEIDRFASSHGRALHQTLAERQARSGGRHLADLYRRQYLTARGSIPLDPISQAPAVLYRLPANLLHAPLVVRAAVLIHSLAGQWLDHRAGCAWRTERPFDCPTAACTGFGLYRQIDTPSDRLVRKHDPTHVAVVYRGRVGFVRAVSDAGTVIGTPAIGAAIDAFIREHERFADTSPFVHTTLAKGEALALRATMAPSSHQTMMRRCQEALAVVEIDDRVSPHAAPSALLLRTQFGDGGNRWFGNLNLVLFASDHFGFVVDHALIDGSDAVEIGRAIRERAAAHPSRLPARRPETDPRGLLSGEHLVGCGMTHQQCRAAIRRYRSACSRHRASMLRLDLKEADPSQTALLAVISAQLGYLRQHGRLAEAYLPVSMKHYRFGRVAGVRAAFSETLLLADAVQNHRADAAAQLLQANLQRWKALIASTRLDGGMDRHLANLARLASELAIDVPLFAHARIRDRFRYPEITTTALRSDPALMALSFPVLDGVWGVSTIIDHEEARVTVITPDDRADHAAAAIARVFGLLRTYAADHLRETAFRHSTSGMPPRSASQVGAGRWSQANRTMGRCTR
jgi:hypothetical protein